MKATQAELDKINQRLPGGATVTMDQVEVLPFNMFDSLETDRSTVMTPEMMNGIVRDLNNGMVAMNSMHQSNYTLPAGRSISGRVITEGAGANKVMKVQAKMYAVTKRPDGTPMEDGKDIADRYNTGAVYACSAGVNVGLYKCSICGNDIRDYKNCDHWPGETYQIDEKPAKCVAYMTGHNIVDGPNGPEALDCGAYELSAVTAGGVRQAGIMSESFHRYDKTVDLKDFKKTEFENKVIPDIITAVPSLTFQKQEESQMVEDTTLKDLQTAHYALIGDKAKIDVEHVTLKASYEKLEGENVGLKTKVDEYTTKITGLESIIVTKDNEFATERTELTGKVTAAEATVSEFTQKVADAEAVAAAAVAFQTAFVAVVVAEGTKVGATIEGYEALTLDKLQELYAAHQAEVAKLPGGQQTLADGDQAGQTTYQAFPDECFKL